MNRVELWSVWTLQDEVVLIDSFDHEGDPGGSRKYLSGRAERWHWWHHTLIDNYTYIGKLREDMQLSEDGAEVTKLGIPMVLSVRKSGKRVFGVEKLPLDVLKQYDLVEAIRNYRSNLISSLSIICSATDRGSRCIKPHGHDGPHSNGFSWDWS